MNQTEQRKIIIRELKNAKSHTTAEELFNNVKKFLPQISLGTIYRNLEILCSNGSVRKLSFEHRKAQFEWKNPTENFIHSYCPECGKIAHVSFSDSEKLQNLILEIYNETEADEIKLDLIKVCNCCKEAKAEQLIKAIEAENERKSKILTWNKDK